MSRIVLKHHIPGYKLDMPVRERREVLEKAVEKKGYVPIMRQVNALSILLRNRSPANSKRAESDKNWLMRTYRDSYIQGKKSGKKSGRKPRKSGRKSLRKPRKPRKSGKKSGKKSGRKPRKSGRKSLRKPRKSGKKSGKKSGRKSLRKPRKSVRMRFTSPYTNQALRERLKKRIIKGSKGGKPGQWSARKAQLLAAEYKKAGGRYRKTRTKAQKSLSKWTREKWGTKSGRPSLATGERYLPLKARKALSSAEYAATTRAKRRDLRRGRQFSRQPRKIAKKTARYRL